MLSVVAGLGLVAALAAPAVAYDVASVSDGGVLAGVVRFAGVPPEPLPSRADAPRNDCRGHEDAEALVLGPGRGVQGGVILVEGVERGKEPATGAVLDTGRCAFERHVTAVMTGERAHVRNDDTILHNPQGFRGTPAVFNLALPGRGQTIDITRRLARPGVIRVVCDLHPNMAAWIVVHDSPYYAVTDERGGYRIDGIPPGRYRVTMWHEGFRARTRDADGRPQYDAPRTLRKNVTIGPGQTATMDFELR